MIFETFSYECKGQNGIKKRKCERKMECKYIERWSDLVRSVTRNINLTTEIKYFSIDMTEKATVCQKALILTILHIK